MRVSSKIILLYQLCEFKIVIIVNLNMPNAEAADLVTGANDVNARGWHHRGTIDLA